MLEEIRLDLIEQYEPATNWELRLIDDAVRAYFRVLRSRRFERGLFNVRLRAENQPPPSAPTTAASANSTSPANTACNSNKNQCQ